MIRNLQSFVKVEPTFLNPVKTYEQPSKKFTAGRFCVCNKAH